MPLLIETDIGRDPDDFFALCYLLDAGVEVKAITITPGDRDQVAFARFVLKECGVDIPIGIPSFERKKSSLGGIHVKLLGKYGYPATAEPDGVGKDIIAEKFAGDPDIELFIIGPLNNIGHFLREHPGVTIRRATMMGAFIGGPDVLAAGVKDAIILKKFSDIRHYPTFNLIGAPWASDLFLAADVRRLRFVSKNVTHACKYDKTVHQRICSVPPKTRAGELLREGMSLYLENHDPKKFHDPIAAVCHLHPEIAVWVRGDPEYVTGQWGRMYGTRVSEWGKSEITAGIDKQALWHYIETGT